MKKFHSDSFKNESSEAINKRGGCGVNPPPPTVYG